MDEQQALLATVATQTDFPEHPKEVDDRYGITEEAPKVKGRAGGDGDELTTSTSSHDVLHDEHEAHSPTQTSDLEISKTRPPAYDFVGVDFPERTQSESESGLEEDPLWRCVQSELERENGKFYRYFFRDRKSTDPHSIDPVRRAASMGLKIIILSYLPLTHYICLFLWCLFLFISMSYFVIFQYVTSSSYMYHNISASDCTIIGFRKFKIIEDVVIAVAFILALADFLVLMIYSVRECYKQHIPAPSPERTPLLRPSVVRSKLETFLFYWRKYGDIPRLILPEALLYTLYAVISLCYPLAETKNNFFQVNFMIVFPAVIITFFCIQFAFASTALYSVCCKPTISSSNKTVGLLLGFILNFLLQRIYQGFQFYASTYRIS